MSAMMKMHVIVAATIGFWGLPTTNSALTAQDCSVGQHSYIAVKDILPPSETIKETNTIWGRLVERPGPQFVVGYRCLVEFTQRMMSWQGASKAATPRGVETVDRDVCLNAHKTKTINLHGNIIKVDVDGAVSHSVRIFNPENQPWIISNNYYIYDRTYVITLSRHTGAVDFERDIVSFDLEVDCDFSSYGCEEDIGQTFWTSEIKTGSEQAVIFTGNITLFKRDKIKNSDSFDRRSLGPESEVTYAVMKGISKMIAIKVHPLNHFDNTTQVTNAFRADRPNWYIDVSNDDSEPGSIYSEGILGESNNTFKTAIDAVNNWCQTEAKFLKDQLNVKVFWGVENLLELPFRGKFGVSGTVPYEDWYRRFIELQINVKSCSWSYVTRRETEECFKDIPVRVKNQQNKEMFLNPISRILVDHAKPVPCVNQEIQFTGTDKVKVTLTVLVSLWGMAILMRLIKSIALRANNMPENENQEQSAKLFTCKIFYDVLKPPFAGKCPLNWNTKRLQEQTMKNSREVETELYALV